MEQELLDLLVEHFQDRIAGSVKSDKRVEIFTSTSAIEDVLMYAKNVLGYIHLVHFSCVDWIEENEFELMYAIFSPKSKITIMSKVRVDRENPVAPNIDYIWRHANTFEREIREMFGIEFTGLIAEKEMILEDWIEMPPMRRDFDTAEYAKKTFFDRPGREDAQDVRETIIKRTGEELPEFSKKYSR
ncbi:MAG: NADH-quinone oxidoreductase subunit C [Bacteroidales bacterium]|nr:NADH-quinone oxidoreductase subunit C [Bacteroidales bacterium]